jgi:hypothetical protein
MEEAGNILWKVSTFINEHNNKLMRPELSSLVANNRYISIELKSTLHQTNISIPCIENIIKTEFAQIQKTWIRKDLYNFVESCAQSKCKMLQTTELIASMQALRDEDSNFSVALKK